MAKIRMQCSNLNGHLYSMKCPSTGFPRKFHAIAIIC